jgi:hypothetical protein
MKLESNPFLKDGESVHSYNGTKFVVDYFFRSDSWQCIDAGFIVKGRGKTRLGAIYDAHNQWDQYIKKNK